MKNNRDLGRVLAIIEDDELRCELQNLLRDSPWKVETARGLDEAATLLRSSAYGLVATGGKHWRAIVKQAHWLTPAPRVIVVERAADEHLWLEVLQHGVYDLVALPLDRREVMRVLALAWVSWCDEAIETESRLSPT
jgi:DNA-binding NtrC family response regulator